MVLRKDLAESGERLEFFFFISHVCQVSFICWEKQKKCGFGEWKQFETCFTLRENISCIQSSHDGPWRKQESWQHLRSFKVVQTSLKIVSKLDLSHLNFAHSGGHLKSTQVSFFCESFHINPALIFCTSKLKYLNIFSSQLPFLSSAVNRWIHHPSELFFCCEGSVPSLAFWLMS